MTGIHYCEIMDITQLTESVYSVKVYAPELVDGSSPGQFINIKCGQERLLRRPISISAAAGDSLTFVYESKGEGTRWLSGRKVGESLDILGPLGKGFDMPDGDILVVGGGIGAPPMLFAAALTKGRATAVLGFRDSKSVILRDDFDEICESVIITTDDGSYGVKGYVLLPLEELLEKGSYSAVLACGPKAMLKAVAIMCGERGVPIQVSLEERMACGIGACVVCACATVVDGVESMSRVCKDGPVFDGAAVRW